MRAHRVLSLAAGVAQEFPPPQVIGAAAEAGFDAAGIWCDTDHWSAATTRAVRGALAATGLRALDLEVAWMHPGEALDCHDHMVDIALEVGASNLLCVSSETDTTRTKRRFEQLCRRAEQGGLRVVLEFLALTEIASLTQALDVVQDVGHPAGGVLVDALHLQRNGSSPQDVAAIDPALLPYLQLCDAAGAPADASPEGLLEDALYLRRLPGEGTLPLRELLLSVADDTPLSMEIRSRALFTEFPDDPLGRARKVMQATRQFLDAQRGG